MLIHTPRLTITSFLLSDIDRFHAYRNESQTALYQSWPKPYTRSSAAHFVEWAAGATLNAFTDSCQFAIRLTETSDLIGDIAMLGDLSNGPQAMVGYTLSEAYVGHGYAIEAVHAMLQHAFGVWGLHRVAADTDPRNHRSIRLLERLGFRREGHMISCYQEGDQWLDSMIYGMLAHEWRNRNPAHGWSATSG